MFNRKGHSHERNSEEEIPHDEHIHDSKKEFDRYGKPRSSNRSSHRRFMGDSKSHFLLRIAYSTVALVLLVVVLAAIGFLDYIVQIGLALTVGICAFSILASSSRDSKILAPHSNTDSKGNKKLFASPRSNHFHRRIINHSQQEDISEEHSHSPDHPSHKRLKSAGYSDDDIHYFDDLDDYFVEQDKYYQKLDEYYEEREEWFREMDEYFSEMHRIHLKSESDLTESGDKCLLE